MHARPARRSGLAAGLALAVALTSVAGCIPGSDLEFKPLILPAATVGTPYLATITVSNASTPVGNASVEEGALPPGLDMALAQDASNTIQISGTPTAAGTYKFTVYVWCYGTNVAGQSASQKYELVVN